MVRCAAVHYREYRRDSTTSVVGGGQGADFDDKSNDNPVNRGIRVSDADLLAITEIGQVMPRSATPAAEASVVGLALLSLSLTFIAIML